MECCHDRKPCDGTLRECYVGLTSVSGAQAGSYVMMPLAPRSTGAGSAQAGPYVIIR